MRLTEWAARWGVPYAALADMQSRLLALDGHGVPGVIDGSSEAAIQARLRLRASKMGMRLWRNNVGAGYSEDGSFMRWGLANDSKQVNAVIKSGDLIGIRPIVVQPTDVGKLIGQFVSREVKHGSWKYSGTSREVAQLNWANLVNGLGGDAAFATSEEGL
jgi:hypothetical protein